MLVFQGRKYRIYDYFGKSKQARIPATILVRLLLIAGFWMAYKKICRLLPKTGLVGRIVETGANWSKVMSIIDYDSGVSAIVELTRDNGVVQGASLTNTNEPLLEMAFLPFDTDILPGYRVITSGLGGVYPKGALSLGTPLK